MTLTLDALPLFPLQTVLFPDGALSLQIFEVRYLDMIARCHEAGTPFGVVCLSRGAEVRRAGEGGHFAPEQFHDVGTLARIDTLERPRPGLYLIRCVGMQRFKVERKSLLKHGLWTADVSLLPDDPVVPVPDHLQPARVALESLVSEFDRAAREEDASSPLPIQGPYQWDDCGWLANRWAELLPLPTDQRQHLMSLDNPVLRLEVAADLLENLHETPSTKGRMT